jgi:myosin-5
LQALLQTERQATEAAKREHAESERRNDELIKKFEGAEKKIEQLQDTVQRYSLNKVPEYH